MVNVKMQLAGNELNKDVPTGANTVLLLQYKFAYVALWYRRKWRIPVDHTSKGGRDEDITIFN